MQTQKARQVKNWLLLFFRMAFLAALILAFAQPVFTQNADKTGQSGLAQVLVFLDDSESMFSSKEGKTTFDLAQNTAKNVPENFGKKGWFQLVSNAFQFRPWASAKIFSDQTTELTKSLESRAFSQILAKANREVRNQKLGEQKQIWLISDFQKSQMGDIRQLAWDSTLRYQLMAVEQPSLSNFWIDSVWLPRPLDIQAKSQMIKVKLRSSGKPKEEKINLQLFANGSLISGKLLDWKGQNEMLTELPFRIKPNEMLACTLQVDDREVGFDNYFYFKIQAPKAPRVYLISNQKKEYLDKVFQAGSQFYLHQSGFQNLNFSKLKKADLVVLNQPENLDQGLTAALLENMEMGKSVLLIPGEKAMNNASFFQNLGLEIQPGPANAKAEDWKIGLPEKESRFFENSFREITPSSLKPFAKPFLFPSNMVPLLKYESGQAYLAEKSVGKGTLFLLSAPLENGLSNIQKHPLIIPMLYRIGYYSKKGTYGRLYSRSRDEFFYFEIDSALQIKEQVIDISNEKNSWKTTLSLNGNVGQAALPSEGLPPGFYDIKWEKNKIGILAVNAISKESVFDFWSPQELADQLGNKPFIKINEIKAGSSEAHAGQSHSDSIPLWKFCLGASIMFLLMEMWLARQNLLKQSQPL
jgi:hypothetical protein